MPKTTTKTTMKNVQYAVVYKKYGHYDDYTIGSKVFDSLDDASRFHLSIEGSRLFGLNPEFEVTFDPREKQ